MSRDKKKKPDTVGPVRAGGLDDRSFFQKLIDPTNRRKHQKGGSEKVERQKRKPMKDRF